MSLLEMKTFTMFIYQQQYLGQRFSWVAPSQHLEKSQVQSHLWSSFWIEHLHEFVGWLRFEWYSILEATRFVQDFKYQEECFCLTAVRNLFEW